ncbi:trypsin-like serine peptidase [Streptomyces sp. NEAU-Y11]|uniref:trypsin-like serine peptidase n=1 Tax=Streptomyces cucumeris TaxID=2962890 RepID=UPI0020C8813C|nr:peptidase [Streptomyces sp. NEAU-Y11]MCP9206659.1 peptidase [Streptomyces sp. NEAU-Y11]
MTAHSPRRRNTALAALVGAGAALALTVPVSAVAAPGGGSPAPAAEKAAAPVVSTASYTVKQRRDALAYWTPARIKAVGESTDLGPTPPNVKPWKGTEMKTVGRLFFMNGDGEDSWCTATAVTSANRSVVMAAGHCVRRGSAPDFTYTEMVFVPGYHQGKQPYGAFPVRATLTPRTWAEESDNDVAALVVDADQQGRKLTDVVGGQAIAFDRPVGGTIRAFGYPASRPSLGEDLLHCTGTAKKAPQAGEQVIPCGMTGGSSGGPWLADFDTTTGKGVLVSVNSHGEGLQDTEKMFGAVLGGTAKKVYDQAQRG